MGTAGPRIKILVAGTQAKTRFSLGTTICRRHGRTATTLVQSYNLFEYSALFGIASSTTQTPDMDFRLRSCQKQLSKACLILFLQLWALPISCKFFVERTSMSQDSLNKDMLKLGLCTRHGHLKRHECCGDITV